MIVGFSKQDGSKRLFHHRTPDSPAELQHPAHLNAYLADAPEVFNWNRSTPVCDIPRIEIGSRPIDNGNYLFTPEEKEASLKAEPAAARYLHRWMGSQEFLQGKERWVLWLGEITSADLKNMPLSRQRIQAVREFRLTSKRSQTLKAA